MSSWVMAGSVFQLAASARASRSMLASSSARARTAAARVELVAASLLLLALLSFRWPARARIGQKGGLKQEATVTLQLLIKVKFMLDLPAGVPDTVLKMDGRRWKLYGFRMLPKHFSDY
jgi:hypothetical protein